MQEEEEAAKNLKTLLLFIVILKTPFIYYKIIKYNNYYLDRQNSGDLCFSFICFTYKHRS